MKKNLFKMFSFVFVFALLVTGCATVSDIKNTDTDLIFNGGNVVKVGDYVYFANGYTAVGDQSKDFDYDGNAKISYMNRVNLNGGFASANESPKVTEKVNSRVVGFESEYMFVLGDYIYFSTVNTHKNKQVENEYNLVSYFRSRLNGDGLSEIYTTTTYDKTKAMTRVLKGSDNNYHLVIFDGTNLNSFAIGNSVGKRQELAKDVTSIAMPKEKDNYEYKKILYTVNSESTGSDTEVYSVDYATNKKEKATSVSDSTKFIDRQGDMVIYTNGDAAAQAYYKYLSDDISIVLDGSDAFYRLPEITNLHKVCEGDADKEGYVFLGKSGSIMYKNMVRTGEQATILLDKSETDFSNMLFVEGDWVYYSTTKGIYAISARDKTRKTIVEMQNEIEPSACSYVDNYIYYYAKLEPVDSETDDKEYEEDNNYYAYRVDVSGQGNYQMLSNFKRVEKKA